MYWLPKDPNVIVSVAIAHRGSPTPKYDPAGMNNVTCRRKRRIRRTVFIVL